MWIQKFLMLRKQSIVTAEKKRSEERANNCNGTGEDGSATDKLP